MVAHGRARKLMLLLIEIGVGKVIRFEETL